MPKTNIRYGEYDSIEDNEQFASRVSHDLRTYDKQGFVRFWEPGLELKTSDAGPISQKVLDELRADNFGFGNTAFDPESVPGYNVATLPILLSKDKSPSTGGTQRNRWRFEPLLET